jgi:hypothetical protein
MTIVQQSTLLHVPSASCVRADDARSVAKSAAAAAAESYAPLGGLAQAAPSASLTKRAWPRAFSTTTERSALALAPRLQRSAVELPPPASAGSASLVASQV